MIGSGLVAAVKLCAKRDDIFITYNIVSSINSTTSPYNYLKFLAHKFNLHPSTPHIREYYRKIMSTANKCANCGKGEENSGDLKACTACKMVNYCNRECQIAHRPQHKKACKKRAAELYDEKLFREHPRDELTSDECPICMLSLPLDEAQIVFESCCGKKICDGCINTMFETGGKDICPFCRTPPVESGEENVKRLKKLMEKGNAIAFCQLAGLYANGLIGVRQDNAKAIELYLKAGELGCAKAYYNLGNSYREGRGVDINTKKAKHYYELAAMNGDITARHNLGGLEYNAGNHQRAYKHFVISGMAGDKLSLDTIKEGYMAGRVTKEDYANTLRGYQQSQDEMKSKARDKALAAPNNIHRW